TTVPVLLGKGDGTFQVAASYSAGSNPGSVAVGDFNGDGKTDLAVADYGSFFPATSGSVSVLLGRGDGTFQAAVDYGVGTNPVSVVVSDFNGDGKPDLAVGGSPISVLLGNGDGTFQAPVNYGAQEYPSSIAVGDFNTDGKLDLVVANELSMGPNNYTNGSVSVLLGNGDGTFRSAVNYGAGVSPDSV